MRGDKAWHTVFSPEDEVSSTQRIKLVQPRADAGFFKYFPFKRSLQNPSPLYVAVCRFLRLTEVGILNLSAGDCPKIGSFLFIRAPFQDKRFRSIVLCPT